MIFNSKKKKLAKSIQSAVSELVSNKKLADDCAELTNSDESASYLYTETLIQEIHSLVFILDRKYRQKYRWATWEYVSVNIKKGIVIGMGKNDFVPIAMNGLSRLMNMEGEGQERMTNIYNSSANLVLEKDPELNREKIVEFIDKNIQSFMMSLGKYFG